MEGVRAWALLWALSACGPKEAPVPGPTTAAACEAQAVAAGGPTACHWEVVDVYYCGGTPPPYEGYGRGRACVCHACGVDADCGEGARCLALPPPGYCDPGPVRVCVADGDVCATGGGCPEGTRCVADAGRAVCAVDPGPPL